jgi:hypothetical protein
VSYKVNFFFRALRLDFGYAKPKPKNSASGALRNVARYYGYLKILAKILIK